MRLKRFSCCIVLQIGKKKEKSLHPFTPIGIEWKRWFWSGSWGVGWRSRTPNPSHRRQAGFRLWGGKKWEVMSGEKRGGDEEWGRKWGTGEFCQNPAVVGEDMVEPRHKHVSGVSKWPVTKLSGLCVDLDTWDTSLWLVIRVCLLPPITQIGFHSYPKIQLSTYKQVVDKIMQTAHLSFFQTMIKRRWKVHTDLRHILLCEQFRFRWQEGLGKFTPRSRRQEKK